MDQDHHMRRPPVVPLRARPRACAPAVPVDSGPLRTGAQTPDFCQPLMNNRMDEPKARRAALPVRIFRFYRDGFRQMTVGRTLWKIIFIKLFVMFAVLKFFFFPDFLATKFSDDRQRADYVLEQLTPSTQGSRNLAQGE
jgi:hypothetical protein